MDWINARFSLALESISKNCNVAFWIPNCSFILWSPFRSVGFFLEIRKTASSENWHNWPKNDQKHPKITKIAIFASGAGSNAANIIRHFEHRTDLKIALIVCNKPGAGVLTIAENAGVPTLLIEKDRFAKGDAYLPELKAAGIDFIVLAGFLWKVPAALVAGYPKTIINIHPALLPKYGGKGMYGAKVHEAVIAAGEKESGITIHYVNEHYDEGLLFSKQNVALIKTIILKP